MSSLTIEAVSLTKNFSGMRAVDDLSLAVPEGSLTGLIGPNGSGKTTTLNLLNGALKPDSGTIAVRGASLAGRSSSAFVHAGVSRTFQNPRVFSTITAMENLLVPVLHRRGRAHQRPRGHREHRGRHEREDPADRHVRKAEACLPEPLSPEAAGAMRAGRDDRRDDEPGALRENGRDHAASAVS